MGNKVLFISHWLPSDEYPTKGIFIRKHAEAIAEFSQITVIHFDIESSKDIFKLDLTESIEDNYVKYCIKIRSKYYKFLYFALPYQYYLFNRLCKKFSIDISKFNLVHTNILFPSAIIGYKISKKHKLPQYHTEHWSKVNHFFKSNIYKKIGLKAYQNCKRISVVSSFLKNEIKDYLNLEKVEIIPNIIDSSEFQFKNKVKINTIQFCAIAQWNSPKNPFYFLDALEQLSNDLDFEINLIGEGKQIEEIKNKKYNFKINYLGVLKSAQINTILQSTDYFLHGSDYETFSVVIVEALATGTPVLTSNIGIAESIISIENGFICENNSLDWKNNILKAIELDYNHSKIADSIKGMFDKSTISKLFKDFYSLK